MSSKRTTTPQSKQIKSIHQSLQKIPFQKRARASGFKKRKEQKLSGKTLVISFLLMALQGNNSLQLWAEKISGYKGIAVSKQGVWKRITRQFVRFLEAVLFDAIRQQISSVHRQATQSGLKKRYRRILLQDSTTLALPIGLRWCYPGNATNGERKSQLKLQVIYDVLNNCFVYFEITPFTANDQSKSKSILHVAGSRDLVIRDLGYFSLDCFDLMKQEHIHYISRLRYGVKLKDAQTGKDICLLQQLRTQQRFDRWVCIGEKQQVKMRLVALPLPEEQAGRRRHKARHDRDKRVHHSKEYYEQLGYSLYITTESDKQFRAEQIAKVYGWRWRIESIFKCWKSQFHLQRLISQHVSLSKERVEAIVYMLLLFIMLFQVAVYNYLIAKTTTTRSISLTKLSRYLADNIQLFFEKNLSQIAPYLLNYCTYERRHDRKNFIEKLKLG